MGDCREGNKQRQKGQQSDASGNLINHCCMDRTRSKSLDFLTVGHKKQAREMAKIVARKYICAHEPSLRLSATTAHQLTAHSRLPRKEEEHHRLLLLI